MDGKSIDALIAEIEALHHEVEANKPELAEWCRTTLRKIINVGYTGKVYLGSALEKDNNYARYWLQNGQITKIYANSVPPRFVYGIDVSSIPFESYKVGTLIGLVLPLTKIHKAAVPSTTIFK